MANVIVSPVPYPSRLHTLKVVGGVHIHKMQNPITNRKFQETKSFVVVKDGKRYEIDLTMQVEVSEFEQEEEEGLLK